MSMQSLERMILNEAKFVTKNNKLKMTDIQEWSTGKVAVNDGEKGYYLPTSGVNVAIKLSKKEKDNIEAERDLNRQCREMNGLNEYDEM